MKFSPTLLFAAAVALWFTFRKSYTAVLGPSAEYDEANDIPAHPTLYVLNGLAPTTGATGSKYLPTFVQMNGGYVYSGIIRNVTADRYEYAGAAAATNFGFDSSSLV